MRGGDGTRHENLKPPYLLPDIVNLKERVQSDLSDSVIVTLRQLCGDVDVVLNCVRLVSEVLVEVCL